MKKKLYIIILCIFSFCFDRVFALSDIKINNESVIPYFDINTKVYNYFSDKDSVLISVSKDKDEEVSGYGVFNIINGENIFKINSNKSGEYTIRIYKNYSHDDENIATFKYFNIDGYDIDFKNDIHDYYIDAYDNEYLRFNYETDSSISTVKIENNGNFNDGNNDVIVNITSNNNMNNNKYVIHVSKTKSVFKSEEDSVRELSYNSKKIVIIGVITICSFLVVLCFYLLFIKKIF